MQREQAVIKLPQTEIPVLAFQDPGFWVFTLLSFAIAFYWLKTRSRK